MRALFLCLDFAANRDLPPLPSGEKVGVRGSPGDVKLLNKRLKNAVDVSQDIMTASPAELAPHQLLRLGHPASQRTCMLVHREAPSPNPLPNGERASEPFLVANPCPIHH